MIRGRSCVVSIATGFDESISVCREILSHRKQGVFCRSVYKYKTREEFFGKSRRRGGLGLLMRARGFPDPPLSPSSNARAWGVHLS